MGTLSMPLANYLKRRGGTYSVRLTVPKDLVEIVGKTEIVKALGRVHDPAEAKRKGAAKTQEIRDYFQRLQTGARLTGEMIERECQEIARYSLEFLRTERLAHRYTPAASEGEDDSRD